MSEPPVLAVTSGDPCGIGPEVILKSLGVARGRCRLIVIGDLSVFERLARRLRRRLPRWVVTTPEAAASGTRHAMVFVDLRHRARWEFGRSSAGAGAASLNYLAMGARLCRQGIADALVTAPVTKWAIERVRPRFVGQTEYLAEACGTKTPVMMFVSPSLRVVLLTRHLSLREVPSRVTAALLRRTLRITAKGLAEHFTIRRPRLAICGLNPHAGEGGLFGAEERRVLLPVLRSCRREGIRLDGPFAADGFFAAPNAYDAVMCWYHDQGLIPFKMAARDRGCQLTLGLPFVRTSPDHGSALDIAGHGRAHPGSMRYALELAAQLASRRGHPHRVA